jgi:zinc transport system permease protein
LVANQKQKLFLQVIETFLVNPFFAITLIAIASSLLGVFVLWKKLSYFGDALSHSILLGLVIGATIELNQVLAIIFFATIFAFLVRLISQNRYFSKDVIIMILSYFCVALAVIFNDIWLKNFSFSSYIFGDILTATDLDVIALFTISLVTIFYVIFAFKKILLINVSEDLAKIEGVKVEFWNLSFLILLSIVVALSVRIVGVFLMTALLILPAAIARIFSLSAKHMIFLSPLIAILIATFSFKAAITYDLTISSAIVVIFSTIFITSLTLKKIFLK